MPMYILLQIIIPSHVAAMFVLNIMIHYCNAMYDVIYSYEFALVYLPKISVIIFYKLFITVLVLFSIYYVLYD